MTSVNAVRLPSEIEWEYAASFSEGGAIGKTALARASKAPLPGDRPTTRASVYALAEDYTNLNIIGMAYGGGEWCTPDVEVARPGNAIVRGAIHPGREQWGARSTFRIEMDGNRRVDTVGFRLVMTEATP